MISTQLPIYDSLVHPSFCGQWKGRSRFPSSTFDDLSKCMQEANVSAAIASTYPSNEIIDHHRYSLKCRTVSDTSGLHINPAYILTVDHINSGLDILDFIKRSSLKYGFTSIVKLNSSFISYNDFSALKMILHTCFHSLGDKFVLYVCTYPFSCLSQPKLLDIRPLLDFLSSVKPLIPIVLLHGGTVNLLSTSQYAQHFTNIYIDISFTICRYLNSSLFYDLCYLVEYLDQKVIIGSDHPEYNYQDLRYSICSIERHILNVTNLEISQLKLKLFNIMNGNLSNLVPL